MEHQIAEIKGEFAFDVVSTRDYQGNSAHQLISVLDGCMILSRIFCRV